MMHKVVTAVMILVLMPAGMVRGEMPVRIGAKNFNEGYLLGEILAQLPQGAEGELRQGKLVAEIADAIPRVRDEGHLGNHRCGKKS